MNDIVIPEIVIPHLELFGVFFTFFLLLMLILVVSNHWDRVRSHLTEPNVFFWIVGGVAVLLFVPAIGQLLQILWHPQTSGFVGDDKRGYAVLLAAIVGAPLVVWRTVVAHIQSNTAAQGLITDRITKAVEQLGAEKTVWEEDKQHSKPNLEVRLGGIYALERIAQDSERDHITVMEILCAYVRENARIFNKAYRKENVNPRADIQAVMTVIGRRSVGRISFERNRHRNGLPAPYRLGLAYTNLSRISLTDLRLDHAVLSSVDFSKAALRRTKFSGAVMLKTKFDNASIDGADFNLAIVFKTDFTSVENLSNDQVQSMFGNSTTKIPDSATPPKWSTWLVSDDEANTMWNEAKTKAGM